MASNRNPQRSPGSGSRGRALVGLLGQHLHESMGIRGHLITDGNKDVKDNMINMNKSSMIADISKLMAESELQSNPPIPPLLGLEKTAAFEKRR